jgi:hypothetical protein
VELKMTQRVRIVWVAVWCLGLSIAVSADTLVLRDGRRVQGELIGVRDGIVEFDGVRGGFFGGRERIRVNREDVARIDLEESVRDSGGSSGGSGTGRPSGLRERDVSVNAATAWNDTGVMVREGQSVYFTASGRVRWGPGRQDGPAGEKGSPRNAARPIPSRPAAALIGRVGSSDDYFFIGDETGGVRMRSSGRLFLGINDDILGDNTGAFRVTVYY